MRSNPPRLIVTDELLIPNDHLREKIVSDPDKVQIKAAVARGQEIAGVRLGQSITLRRSER